MNWKLGAGMTLRQEAPLGSAPLTKVALVQLGSTAVDKHAAVLVLV